MPTQTITLPDGRQLGYHITGEGKPIVYFHGTASSRLETQLLSSFCHTHHFQIIGLDRPGYGLSTYTERRNLHDFTADINYLTKHLKLDKFAILSWSGGGPFALTYTALFPQKVTKTVAVGSPFLPFNVATAHNNNPLARFAMKIPALGMYALKMFKNTVLSASQNIPAYLNSRNGKNMLTDWPPPDKKFFADPNWLKLMYGAIAEGFRQDNLAVKTVFQEHRLFMNPWREPIEQIPEGKLVLWQGTEDKTCPVENAEKTAQKARGTRVEVFEGEGHCVMFSKQEQLAAELNS